MIALLIWLLTKDLFLAIMVSLGLAVLAFMITVIVQYEFLELDVYKYSSLFPFALIQMFYRKLTHTHPYDNKGYLRFDDFAKFYKIAPEKWSFDGYSSNGCYQVAHKELRKSYCIDPRDHKKIKQMLKRKSKMKESAQVAQDYTLLLEQVQKDINEYRDSLNIEMRKAVRRI